MSSERSVYTYGSVAFPTNYDLEIDDVSFYQGTTANLQGASTGVLDSTQPFNAYLEVRNVGAGAPAVAGQALRVTFYFDCLDNSANDRNFTPVGPFAVPAQGSGGLGIAHVVPIAGLPPGLYKVAAAIRVGVAPNIWGYGYVESGIIEVI
jgi:hypothetical protein